MNVPRQRIKEQALDIFRSAVAGVNPGGVVERALSELDDEIRAIFPRIRGRYR